MVICRVEAVNGFISEGDGKQHLETVLNNLEGNGHRIVSHVYAYGEGDLYEVVITQREEP